MDDLQDKYDELEDIETTLRILAGKIYDPYYKDLIEEIMYQAQDDKERIEPELQAMYDAEDKERDREYWATQF